MDSQWLKTQFEVHPEKTKAGLAAAIGVEPPAVSKILSGSRQIKAQEYVLMREYFGLPVDGHASLHRSPASYTIKPLDGHESFRDGQAAPSDWVLPAAILSPRTKAPAEKIRIFQVREAVMEPDFRSGEYVLVDVSDKKPAPPGIFIVSDGFGNMLRQCEFVPKSEPPAIRISANSNFQPQTLQFNDFLIIGRVIAKLQMY